MTATSQILPTAFVATIPGPNDTRIVVGPFEDRQAAFDFCQAFGDRVLVRDQLYIGPVYPPDQILGIAYEAYERSTETETSDDD
jgi:hypothetical protein